MRRRSGLLALAASGWVQAARAAERWRIATIELPPAIGSQLPQQGYYAVLLRRVLAEIDAEPEFSFLPPQRADQDARGGRFDAILPMRRTAERETAYWFTEPFYLARTRVFLRADDPWEPADEAALRGQLGCTLLGGSTPPKLQREVDAGLAKLQRVSQTEACFRMLQLGRVRYVVAGQNAGLYAAAALSDKGPPSRMASQVLAEEALHLALSRAVPANAERLQAFNRALRRLRANGVMQQLEQALLPPR